MNLPADHAMAVDELAAILDERHPVDVHGRHPGWWVRNALTARWEASAAGVSARGDHLRDVLEVLERKTRPKIDPEPVVGAAVTWDGSDQALEAIRGILPDGWCAAYGEDPEPWLRIEQPAGATALWRYVAFGSQVIVVVDQVVIA